MMSLPQYQSANASDARHSPLLYSDRSWRRHEPERM
jgi:hypothetical protein